MGENSLILFVTDAERTPAIPDKAIDHEQLEALLREIDALPRTNDLRSDEEILGYDGKGMWA